MIAEDDGEMRRMLTAALERDGWEVVALRNGMGLLEYLKLSLLDEGLFRLPDVIVSDVRMPGGDGLEILGSIRAHGLATPVILITAFGDDQLRSRAQELGATAVFDKPFDIALLRIAILVAATRRTPPRPASGP